MINKSQFSIANDKKLLRKIGKKWVVVGTLALALLGGGVVMSTTVTHADTAIPAVKAQATNKVKKQINNNLDKAYQMKNNVQSGSRVNEPSASSSVNLASVSKPSNIQSKATNMYRGLMLNAMKPSNNSNNTTASLASGKSDVAFSGSLSSSSKPSFNSAYQNYMAKMSSTDAKVASANDNNAQSNNNKVNKPLLLDDNQADSSQQTMSDGHWIYNKNTNEYQNYMPKTDNIVTGTYRGLTYKFDISLMALEFTGGSINTPSTSYFMKNYYFGYTPRGYSGTLSSDYPMQSIKFDNDVDTSHVTDMSNMFYDNWRLVSLDLGNNFNTSNVTNMANMFHDTFRQGMTTDKLTYLTLPKSFNTSKVTDMANMFKEDTGLGLLNLPNTFDTSKVTNMADMFSGLTSQIQPLTLPKSFTTSKATNTTDILYNATIPILTITSPYTKFNWVGRETFHKYYFELPQKDNNGNNYTLSIPNNFSKSSVGTFTLFPNIPNDTIDYQYNGNTIATQQFSANGHDNKAGNGYSDLDVNNADDFNIPSGYHLVNADTTFAFDGNTHNVPIEPNQATDTINYMYNNQYLGGFTKSGNSSNAQDASDTNFTIGNTPSDLPANYHIMNPNQSFNYDGGTHTVQIALNNATDIINFVNQNNTNVGTTTATGIIGTKFTVTNIPKGYYLTNPSSNQLTYDGQPHTIHVVGEATHQEVRYIDTTTGAQMATSGQFAGQYNNQSPIGPVVGIQDINNVGIVGQNDIFELKPLMTLNSASHQQFNKLGMARKSIITLVYTNRNGLDIRIRLVNTVGSLCNIYQESYQHVPSGYTVDDSATFSGRTPKSVIVPRHRLRFLIFVNKATAPKPKDNDNVYKILQVPAGYTLVNNENPFKLADNGVYNVAVKENIVSDTINYTDNGKIVSTTKISGRPSTNDDMNILTAQNVPDGYHLANIHNTVPFDGTSHNIPVVGDMVGGTATINLIYQRGNHTYMNRAYVNLSSNIGDPDIVINPQDYDRDGYDVASSNNVWKISFDYNTVNTISHGDLSRYNRENTFIYKARPTDIKIQYVDTKTNQPVNNPDDLGKIAYDGDTIDLEDTNSSNGVVSVDGNNYRLNLPDGYHLAHANNYILVNANDTYTKQVSNGVGGFRAVRMPLMKLTLGITPHFNKPASSSSVTPVKPSSASSTTPSSAKSVQPSSASTVPSSVAPSSASQSTASIIPIMLPSSEASSASQPSSVAPASEATKPSSASASPAPSVAKKPVTKPTIHKVINHKSMANHSEARLNHSINRATKQLSTVERHMKARKATKAKIVKKLVHAKKTIKVSKHKLTYLHHNKRHVAHALRRITRNKVAIKHAKRVIHSVKAKRVTESKVTNAKAHSAKSIKNSVNTPKAKASSANQSTVTKKLPQTGEASHAGLIASILMMASAILAGFGKLFDRKRTE